MSCTGAVRSTASTLPDVVAEIAATNITERGETRADDRASEAAMEDRKKEGLFLAMDLLRLATAGSVDDGKSTLIGRLLYDAKAVLADQLAHVRGAQRRRASTSRCSPTACAPSASRASRSTSPTARSRRPGGASSSPTAPATRSTRATWSRARRRPISPCCWSTPAPG